MAGPSQRGGYGATAFPLALPSNVRPIDGLDPQQAALAALLKDAINAEVGDEWRKACARLNEPSDRGERVHYLNRTPNGNPVAEVVDAEPSPALMGQRLAGWPVLAVYREGEPETEQWSIDEESRTKQKWAVDWVIGPLDAGDQIRLGKFANVVADVVRYTISEGFHPAHQNRTCVLVGLFASLRVIGQMGPGVAQVLGDEKGNGYYGISILLQGRSYMEKTSGDPTDLRNKYYQAYREAPAGTPITEITVEATIANETPDPVTP